MPRKLNPTESSSARTHSVVAAMKFWSRFKHPPPMLAFTFAEPAESVADSQEALNRLPSVLSDDSVVYSLRISLDDSKPSVWRRVLVKAANLEVLHHIIQLTMGWNDSHLHGFEIRRTRVPLVEDGAAIDERAISIAQLHAAHIKKFRYTYDFGDDWRHTIVIEDACAASPTILYPQCVDGKGIAPLEDIGGMRNWSSLLDAIRHPEKEREEEIDALLGRLGPDFSPLAFDLAKINLRLQRAFNKRLRGKGRA